MTFEEMREILKAEDESRGMTDKTDNFSAILDMTDQQAADIIEDMYFNPQMVGGRHQGKTYMQACRMVAVLKAIHKLRGDTNCLR